MNDTIAILCFLCFTLLMGSCNKCGGIACSTGPPSFSLELIDKETGENVFTSGKYKPEDIVITDENQKTVSHYFIAENSFNIINVGLPAIKGDKELKMGLNGKQVIIIKLHVRKGESNCCTNYFAENITVEDFAYSQPNKASDIKIEI